MPYIKPNRRDAIHHGSPLQSSGELNYAITRLCIRYINQHGLSYAVCNAVLGVLSAVPRELYRRVIAPYEDIKKEENGDLRWPWTT